jgi:hypothetical protein
MSRAAMQMALEALTLDLGSAAQIDREADAIAALRAALAEQPEPYGSVTTHSVTGQQFFYRWPQPPYIDNASECVTVYTAPTARVPLTEAQARDIVCKAPLGDDWEASLWIVRETERRHGITGEQE